MASSLRFHKLVQWVFDCLVSHFKLVGSSTVYSSIKIRFFRPLGDPPGSALDPYPIETPPQKKQVTNRNPQKD